MNRAREWMIRVLPPVHPARLAGARIRRYAIGLDMLLTGRKRLSVLGLSGSVNRRTIVKSVMSAVRMAQAALNYPHMGLPTERDERWGLTCVDW
jgi:hypothetical protein